MASLVRHRSRKLRFYASNNDGVSVSGDIYVYTHDLTSDEHKKVVGRVIRGVPKMLENIPYTDFGFDNISVKKVKS
jgi:UPF0288 family protein (methanogenesis marker protein 3)